MLSYSCSPPPRLHLMAPQWMSVALLSRSSSFGRKFLPLMSHWRTTPPLVTTANGSGIVMWPSHVNQAGPMELSLGLLLKPFGEKISISIELPCWWDVTEPVWERNQPREKKHREGETSDDIISTPESSHAWNPSLTFQLHETRNLRVGCLSLAMQMPWPWHYHDSISPSPSLDHFWLQQTLLRFGEQGRGLAALCCSDSIFS